MEGSIHPDSEMPGAAYHRGVDGDVRRGTVYGWRTAAEYNKIKAAAKEKRYGSKVELRYYARKLINDDYIKEFVVENGPLDPSMFVATNAPDGSLERWMRIEEDGAYVFLAPPGYTGGPIAWAYDRKYAVRGTESKVYESKKAFFDPRTIAFEGAADLGGGI